MTNIQITEDSLDIEALRAGDKAAFAQMVAIYADRLYNLIYKLLGNPQEAEDALQETFVNAFRNIDRFEGRSQLGTWLYRIAHNTALMRLRKKRPDTVSIDEPVTLDDGETLPRQLYDWRDLPEDELLTGESLEYMDEAIQQLPETLRIVFVLRDIEGLSTAETGDVLSLSESAVKSRLHRARLFLRERLSEYFREWADNQRVP
jgi:RNA polymerase sigma-70 factor (ECF subfamily)